MGSDDVDRWERLRRRLRRAQAWVLCYLGRHSYARRRNPEVGGASAVYVECRRCGHEPSGWDSPSPGLSRMPSRPPR